MSKIVIVYGGAGQLGEKVCEKVAAASLEAWSVDFKENPAASENVIIKGDASADAAAVLAKLAGKTVRAVICVAGGWAGGAIDDNAVFESSEKMINFNVFSSLAAAHVGAKSLDKDGTLVLTGALAALDPTPGMIGYGMAKAAVHHLLSSVVEAEQAAKSDRIALAIAPVTLDTPSNRAAMPKADFSTWTPLELVADEILTWVQQPADKRPKTGSIVAIKTMANQTTFTPV